MSVPRGRARRHAPAAGRRWAVGVDLGGSRLRAVALDESGRRRARQMPTPGLAGLPASVRELWRGWHLTGSEVAALVVASRGVWTPAERRIEARRLAGLGRRVRVIADVEAAYVGAVGERAGLLVLAGTGSMVLGRDARGRWARAGGLGPLLGDDGSAFWIGREWLRAGPRARAATARRLGRSPDAVTRIAALAPGVLARARDGSRPARRIVRDAQSALAALLTATARELRLAPPAPVSWSGGLLQDERFRAGVWRMARRRGLPLMPAAPRATPVEAAVRLAARLAAEENAPSGRSRRGGDATGPRPGRRAGR